MEKLRLPAIMEEAKAKPLSYNPHTQEYIYYEDVAAGKQKIYPVQLLDNKQKKKLTQKRYSASETGDVISTLNGEAYTRKQIIEEIENDTPVGTGFADLDMNYLMFYLEDFPKEAFGE
ncbi:MAG TPA: hypothetical protein VL098_07675 [Flavipsychrobacter sp.]|nr:hypothetical protein [Flavipsychrobacter sp.]